MPALATRLYPDLGEADSHAAARDPDTHGAASGNVPEAHDADAIGGCATAVAIAFDAQQHLGAGDRLAMQVDDPHLEVCATGGDDRW